MSRARSVNEVSRDSVASTLQVHHEDDIRRISKTNSLSDTESNATLPSSISEEAPPNGGLKAWLQVVGGFCLFFNAWGLANAFGVFQTYYSTSLLRTSSNSSISWIGSIASFLIAGSPLIWGPIFDKGHPRRLVILGSFFVVFGLMMTSLCTRLWQLILTQGICLGLGGGCLFLTAIATVPRYFTTKRAVAVGLANVGSSVAGVVYSIVFHELEPRLGFPWAVRVMGFIALATLIVPCALITPRGTNLPHRLFDPVLMKDAAYQCFNLASLFGFIGQYTPFFYVELYASSHGINGSLSFYMLAFTNAGSIFGRVLPGILSDTLFHPLTVLSVCTALAGILCFCWIAIDFSVPGLIVFCVLYGFASGAFVSLQSPAVAKMTPDRDLSLIGTKLGINSFFSASGVLVGSPSAGAIQRKSWTGLQAFTGAVELISAALVLTTKFVYTSESDTETIRREEKKDERLGVEQEQEKMGSSSQVRE